MFDIVKKKKIKKPEITVVPEKKKRNKKRRIFLFLIPREEKEYFIENLAMLLTSGMNISLALDSIRQEVRSKQMKAVIDQMKENVEAGTPMWQVLKATNFFPEFVISLIKIGEGSGNLGKNLKVISIQQKKDRTFNSKLRSAMMYPGFVFGLTLIVGVGVAWFILPRLAIVFDQLKIDLPLITKILISFGKFISQYGSIVVPSFIVSVILIFFFVFFFSYTKFIGQFLLFSFPGIKRLIQETELARMGYIMGTLLKSGLPIKDTMESLIETATFYKYKKFYQYLKNKVEEGNTFQQAFNDYKKTQKIIPATVQQMIVVGERSGQLPETFLAIGGNFEEKIDDTTKNLSVILEPILLVIVWLGVVAVALAVILPIYSLIGGLNNNQNNNSTTDITPPPVTETISNSSADSQDVTGSQNQEQSDVVVPEKKLEIKNTGTGFLNVRDSDSTQGKIITRVTPGDRYIYQEELNGWYKIVLTDGTNGWVSGDYVQIIEEAQGEVEEIE